MEARLRGALTQPVERRARRVRPGAAAKRPAPDDAAFGPGRRERLLQQLDVRRVGRVFGGFAVAGATFRAAPAAPCGWRSSRTTGG